MSGADPVKVVRDFLERLETGGGTNTGGVVLREVWVDSSSSFCVVYEHDLFTDGPVGVRCLIEPMRGFEMVGQGLADHLGEPLGTSEFTVDQFGIEWTGQLDGCLPVPPNWRPGMDKTFVLGEAM